MDQETRTLLISFLDLYLTDAAGGNIYGTICRCLETVSLKGTAGDDCDGYWYVYKTQKTDLKPLYGSDKFDEDDPNYAKFDLKCQIYKDTITFRRYCKKTCETSTLKGCKSKIQADLVKISTLDMSTLFPQVTPASEDRIKPDDVGRKLYSEDRDKAGYVRHKLDKVALHWYEYSRESQAIRLLFNNYGIRDYRSIFQVYDPIDGTFAYRGLSHYEDDINKNLAEIFKTMKLSPSIEDWEGKSQAISIDDGKLLTRLIGLRQAIIDSKPEFNPSSKHGAISFDNYEDSIFFINDNSQFVMIPLFCNGQARGTCAVLWTHENADLIYAFKQLWPAIGREASLWFEQAYEEIFEVRLEEYVHDLNESNAFNIMKGLLEHINCILNCTEGYVHQIKKEKWDNIYHFIRLHGKWQEKGQSKEPIIADRRCTHKPENPPCTLTDEHSHVNMHFCHDGNLKIYISLEEGKQFILDLHCPDLLQHVFNSYAGTLTNRLRETIHRLQAIRKLHKARRKMAAAAIMSRNGSHNIGSHGLSGLTHDKDVRPPDRRFYSYIQHRMDYLATITTEWPVWAPGARFRDEIMRDFKAQTRLLNNICASEGITGEKIEFTAKVKKLGSKGYSETEDLYVPVPGGMVGRHAFYTIFENIMRNAAKHAFSKVRTTDKKLDITVLLEEKNESIKFIIFDNVSKVNIKKKNKENDELLLPKNLASIKEDEDTTNWPLHQQLNHILERPLIDENDILRKEGWGLAEMQLSTAYLKREHDNNHLPTKLNSPITAHPYTHGKEIFLSYEFSLPKVKDILVVGLGEPTDPSTFSSQGIDFRDDTPAICDYSFVVLSLEAFNHMEQKHKILYSNNKELPLPYRRIIVVPDKVSCEYGCQITHDQFKSYISNAPSLKSNIYKSWLDYLRKLRGFDEPITMRILTNPQASTSQSDDAELYDYAWKNCGPHIVDKAAIELTYCQKQKLLGVKANPFISDTNNILRAVDSWLAETEVTIADDLKSIFGTHVNSSIEAIKFLLFDDAFTVTTVGWVRASNNATLLGLEVVAESDGVEKFSYIHHSGESAPKESQYFETLSGSQSYFSQLCTSRGDYDLKFLFYLAENAFLRVLIVDERVTQYLETHKSMEEKFKNMQICVPDAVKYNKADKKYLSLCREDRQEYNARIVLAPAGSEHDILIIHVGVLEKLTGAKKQDEFQEYLNKLRKCYKYVIVVTGRGKPAILPDKEKYLPFTEIEARLFKKYPEKMPLIVSIMEALPHGEQ